MSQVNDKVRNGSRIAKTNRIGDDDLGCGAVGCTTRSPLFEARHPAKGTRVLCRAHVADYLGLTPEELINNQKGEYQEVPV
jgi:hypothetical protein